MGIDKHYRVEWEKKDMFKRWLCKAPKDLILSGQGEAYCKWCRVTLRAHKHDLKVHCSRKTHQHKATSLTSKKQRKLTDTGITTKLESKTKIADIKLVLQIAAHSSTKSIDHLSELLKSLGKGSDLEKLRLHRTKASKIILNVISPGMLKELIKDIDDEDYSIILMNRRMFLQ
ncbi:hypothetical protein KQX54_012491 [Cotesia glomerata]|uniref:Uncharacterized protein n=1 Tax=Cotesia glomerata TaxID=32391 RepID=A0AAV7ID83_COTGL|nr:hypothetical protein KQX54_012491 [Cotesia glomerata]